MTSYFIQLARTPKQNHIITADSNFQIEKMSSFGVLPVKLEIIEYEFKIESKLYPME